MKKLICIISTIVIALITTTLLVNSASDQISFGTTINAKTQIDESKKLASSLANPNSSQWRAKGDQHRTYNFSGVNSNEPYRIYVPTNWDGKSNLPLLMFLHGAWSNESTYLDQNNQQMIKLAQSYGFLLVSPLGYTDAYGNYLNKSAPFGKPDDAAKIMAGLSSERKRTNELSEKDVINVLEIVLNEYPVDRSSMFLTGHSMGSGGTWYIGGKYSDYWKALAPMSGPFVLETGYPWNNLINTPIFVSEGTKATASLDASRLLSKWLSEKNFKSEYKEVDADHGGMVPLIIPDVFKFFERCKNTAVATSTPTKTSEKTQEPTATTIKYGDFNGDGKVTSSDISIIERHILGIVTLTGDALKAADLNVDSKITSTDVSYLERYILGEISILPAK